MPERPTHKFQSYWEEFEIFFPEINFQINENDKYQEISEYIADSRIIAHVRFYDFENKAVVDRVLAADINNINDWGNPSEERLLYLDEEQLLFERWRKDDGTVDSVISLVDIGAGLFNRLVPLTLDGGYFQPVEFTFRRIKDEGLVEVPARTKKIWVNKDSDLEEICSKLKEINENTWRKIKKRVLGGEDLEDLCRTMSLTH
jgi:hypothetical protein